MSDTVTTAYSGVGFPSLLTLVFITLKLLGKITWSWWWVLSPLLISTGFVLIILAINFLIEE